MTVAQVAVERLRAARDEVTQLSFDALTVPELLNLLGELEMDRRRTTRHRRFIGTYSAPDRGAPVINSFLQRGGAKDSDTPPPQQAPPPSGDTTPG